MKFAGLLIAATLLGSGTAVEQAGSDVESQRNIRVLFLGDDGHHEPAERAKQILPPLREQGIDVFYTDDLEVLRLESLQRYDAVLIYANHEYLSEQGEEALLEYVAGGGGFIPVHSASGMFRNSDQYIELVGGAFLSHGDGIVRTRRMNADHPAIRGVPEFESWDETYVHHRHNADRRILEARVDGDDQEAWTWARTHGDGRVFYTAWGHDERTWSNPGFHELLAQGIRWASGEWALSYGGMPDPFEFEMVSRPSLEYGSTLEYERQPRPMQLPLTPEESMQRMVLPPGFSAELYAAEPDIVKPVAMAWDEKGRLWIAETVDYPNDLQAELGVGNDRISILDDTNGDGRADSFTVFATGLSIPTSIAFANGGIVVAQAPQMLFLKDTTGDDRADVKEILFEGWGTFDTHAGPSNLRLGFDNWMWGVLGYAGFEGEVGGEHHQFSMGVYRFKPDGSKLEYIRQTNNNTWGLGFSEEGLVFGSTANNNPSVYMSIADRYYQTVRGWSAGRLPPIAENRDIYPITERTIQGDWKGRYTSAAGHALYTARSFPREYWNRKAFIGDPTVHLLGKFALDRKGSDFEAVNKWNMLASDDEWTSPIVAEVGPDGALWVIDWYNYIPQHNLGPFAEGWEHGEHNAYITELRDRERGRIYRVVHEDAEPYEPLSLDRENPRELVNALRHDNMFWRLTAQRLLMERGEADVLPSLYDLVSDPAMDDIGLAPGAIHALWTMHGLDQINRENPEALSIAYEALEHPSEGVRLTALQVLPRGQETAGAVLDRNLLDDDSELVRMRALLTLSEASSSEEIGRTVYEMIEEPDNFEDRWISDAAVIAGARHPAGFLKAAAESYREGGSSPSEDLSRVVRIVSTHFAYGLYSEDEVPGVQHLHDEEPVEAPADEGYAVTATREPGEARTVTIISPGDVMEFDVTEIRAQAGTRLTIRYVNRGTSPMMSHNVVFLNSTEDIQTVGQAALTAHENEWIPPQHEDKIFAYTPLAGPGETVEVTFAVPPPGEYPYICTFAGHFMAMQGRLISVE